MRALDLYRNQSRGVRLHTALRAWSAPLDAVVGAIPDSARSLLDVGCGHGLVANEFALRYPDARVLGIDLSDTKVAAASASVAGRPNIEFRHVFLQEIKERGFDAVSLVDVLYLVPVAEWNTFLTECFGRLAPGGTFVLKEVVTEPRWKFERIKLQEFISTRVVRITKGDVMHFETPEQLKQRLLALGFEGVEIQALDRGYATPHVLLVARRPKA